MGIYRFFLAFCVLLYHSGASPGFNLGVAAVISFYILAGFVLTNLIDKKFRDKMGMFYLERILRIYPLYLFLALLTLVFVFVTGYGDPIFSLGKIANNLLIIPLNYYMVFDNSIMQSPKWWLIPPAWTLGLELQAYLALSLIIKLRSFKIIASIISLSIFIIATAGIINSDIWGYRLLPGTLFIFLIGSSLYRVINKKSDLFDRIFIPLAYVLCLLLFIILGIKGRLVIPYAKETLTGILIGVPIIGYLSKRNIKNKVSVFLGDMSYGIFLSHFLAIMILQKYRIIGIDVKLVYVAQVAIISLFLAYIGNIIIERRIKEIRYKLS